MIYERSFTFIECSKSGVGMTIGGGNPEVDFAGTTFVS
jgi:hypothetical protein